MRTRRVDVLWGPWQRSGWDGDAFIDKNSKERCMSKTLMIAVVMSLGLAACAEMPRVRIAPDPATPQVTVIEGKFIVVDQEPIVVPSTRRTGFRAMASSSANRRTSSSAPSRGMARSMAASFATRSPDDTSTRSR
jgi:hypothetical protein